MFDISCRTLQPTSISKNGSTQRPMLVIVQNPGMSDFAFSDDYIKEPKKAEGAFNSSYNFQQQGYPSFKGPDSSSSLIDHEGVQLRSRNSGDLSTSAEPGCRRDNRVPDSCERDLKEGSRCVNGKEDRNAMAFVNDVVVDMKGLKGCSFLQFDNPCGDCRTLHSRSNSSIVWLKPFPGCTLFVSSNERPSQNCVFNSFGRVN